ncbi:MAG TPA: DUF87 domain-containing protein, partial [Stenomitos sp.]
QDISSGSQDYLRQQANLIRSGNIDRLSTELVKSRAHRAREMDANGELQNNRIFIYAKYRVPLGAQYAVTRNWFEEFLFRLQPVIGAMTPGVEVSAQKWDAVIRYAFRYCYERVDSVLSSGFGLKLQTLGAQAMYERDYGDLHESPAYAVPHLLVTDEEHTYPVINSGIHVRSALFEPEAGLYTTPIPGRSVIKFPSRTRRQYAGFVELGRVKTYPKESGSISRGAMRFLWRVLAAEQRPVHNCRVICELTKDRSGLDAHSADRIISNSIKREALAAKRQTVDVIAMRRRESAIEARDQLEENNSPYWVSLGIWLYRDSPEELEQDCAALIDSLPTVAAMRATECSEFAWLQSNPYEWEAMLTKPYHKRQKYLSLQAVPLLPLIKIKPINTSGMLFVSREMNTPLLLDIVNQKNHTAIIAKTGSGKSVKMFEMLLEYVLHNYPAVVFDFPRQDGTSTYTDFVNLLNLLGVAAAYHDVRSKTMNVVEMPNLSHVPSRTAIEAAKNGLSAIQERERYHWQQFIEGEKASREDLQQYIRAQHIEILCSLVMGGVKNPDRELIVMSLLTQCYSQFHQDEVIAERYRVASSAAFGSKDYYQMPILEDFIGFAEHWFAAHLQENQATVSQLSRDSIDMILTQLRSLSQRYDHPLGRAINGHSSFDIDVQLLVIGLTDVKEDVDSLIYSMAGMGVLLRKSLTATRSLFACDEGTILFKFPYFAKAAAIIPVHGRKWGCNFLLAAQTIDSIYRSVAGDDIFKNLDNVFSGHIEENALQELVELLRFREEIAGRYADESTKPSPQKLQSYWYLKRGSQHVEVLHRPSPLLLALAANDPGEQKARNRFMAHYRLLYPEDRQEAAISGIKAFAVSYAAAKRQGLDMDDLQPEGYQFTEAKVA